MHVINLLIYITFYVLFCDGKKYFGTQLLEKDHQHPIGNLNQKPCDVCPRRGRCVAKVQCPAHVRFNAYNPECHLGKTGLLGVCCTTGISHASESDHRARSSSAISVEEIKLSHMRSKQKLDDWMKIAGQLEKRPDAVVNVSSPSYAHHLSVRTHDQKADDLGRGGLLNLFATQELGARQAVSRDDIMLGLSDHTDGPFCPPPPVCPSHPSPYRRISGECNNAKFTSWGAVHTGYEKLLPPDYSDGIWEMRKSITGLPLPSARVVSSHLLFDADVPNHTNNLMFMQFGQFIAHDTTSGVIYTIGNGSAISCCAGDGSAFLEAQFQHWACSPIVAAPDDIFYQQFGHQCLNFVRTQLAPSPHCSVGYAKQMNGVTHYLDLSQLYGSSEDKVKLLRDVQGKLKTFNDFGRELPPLSMKEDCLMKMEGAACFESGDSHGNQIISLTVLHTIWTREHNRIAKAMLRLNPDWNEETIFLETRRIVQAELQHIVFNEWLPLLLGPVTMSAFGLNPTLGYASGYDPNTNPSLSAEFAVAAFRFGHSIVDGKIMIPNTKIGSIYESISLPEVMFEPSRMRLKPFLDRILVGMSWQPMQTVDPFITESVADRLSSVYSSPDDIDVWVGGLLEEPVYGGVVGPTFANIIAEQFSRMKRGDRYFYEYGHDVNPGAFTLSQLAEIKKVTLSRIICDNRDSIELNSQARRAFVRADLIGNEPVPCDSPLIPRMDLDRFKVM